MTTKKYANFDFDLENACTDRIAVFSLTKVASSIKTSALKIWTCNYQSQVLIKVSNTM